MPLFLSDSFERADGPLDGTTLDNALGADPAAAPRTWDAPGWAISGGYADPADPADFALTETGLVDHEVSVPRAGLTGTGTDFVYIIGRYTDAANYVLFWYPLNYTVDQPNRSFIIKVVGGVETTVADLGTPPVGTTVLGLRFEGDTVRGYFGGNLFTGPYNIADVGYGTRVGMRSAIPLPGFIVGRTVAEHTGDHLTAHAGTAAAAVVAEPVATNITPTQPWLGYIDEFDTVETNAPNGEPYEGTAWWSVVDGILTPTVGADQYRTVDIGATDLDMRTRVVEGGENAGLVYRWTDAANWVGVSINDPPGPDPPHIYVFTRTAWNYAVVANWPATVTKPCELRIRVVGDVLDVWVDDTLIGTTSTSAHAGATKAGLWTLPWGTFDYLRWDAPSIVPPPEVHATGAQLVAHAGTVGGALLVTAQPAHGHAHDGAASVQATSAITAPFHRHTHAGDGAALSGVTIAMGAAHRGPVAYGPRISQPGTIIPPIVAKVFRLRDHLNPVVTLDQSFARTWQEQIGEAGSGSVTLMNDDPDLALVRNGDVIRFELYGEAAFSFVVAEREKTSIARGEEHDEVTILSGPGLLSWLTSSVLIYPARQPQPLIGGPVPDRYIQGEPVEEDRVFSWASYANLVDLDMYGPTVSLGTMSDPLPEYWPPDTYTESIWVPTDQTGTIYFRYGFTTSEPECEIYLAAPANDPMMAWLDGSLMVESDGSVDSGETQTIGGALSDLGTDLHVLTVKLDHQGGPGWLSVVGFGVNEEGDFTGIVASSGTDWLAIAYPPTPPPVTAGTVLLSVIGEINSRRYNPQLGAAFSADYDSSGNPWPPLPELATKVGTTLWAFMQELADHVEFHMYHDPGRLYAWVAGGRGDEKNVTLHGPTDPHDPNSSNLAGLVHKKAT